MTAFLKFLNGIPDEEMQRWYVSVMLNRLMFIYFIQKKGFLDNNDRLSTHQTDRESSDRAPTDTTKNSSVHSSLKGSRNRKPSERSREMKQLAW